MNTDNANKRILPDRIRKEEFMNFLIMLVLKYELFTGVIFLLGAFMHYFFDGEEEYLRY